MTFNDYSNLIRKRITETLQNELSRAKAEYPSFSGDTAHIFKLIHDYSLAGKMLRGVLACLSAELFGKTRLSAAARARNSHDRGGGRHDQNPEPTDIYKIGAALELLQAGLLIHDDIMDEDSLRRGLPTMHKQFEREAIDSGAENPSHLGEALAICAADICFFSAWNLVSDHDSALQRLFAQELTKVCLAQSRDVRLGSHGRWPALQEILEVYTYKTARYTICLPLLAGAILAGRSDAEQLLEEVGTNLGLLFQLKDDYLGLFGEETSLGKPIGSDLREGKKTPYMLLLYPTLSASEKTRFDSLFGNESIGLVDVKFFRSLILSHGIDTAMNKIEHEYAQMARNSLTSLLQTIPDLNKEVAEILRDFVEYSLSRTS